MIKLTLILCAALAIAQANYGELSSTTANADNFISLNKLQYKKTIQKYDIKIDNFRKQFLGSVGGINLQLEIFLGNIGRVEDLLNPLLVLDERNKACVKQHHSLIPSLSYVRSAITSCVSEASNNIKGLCKEPLTTRNKLEDYYEKHFEKGIENCYEFSKTLSNYTACIIGVTHAYNAFSVKNEKDFENEMEVAVCAANAEVKRSMYCSHSVHFTATTQMAEARMLIKRCLEGREQCKPCNVRNTCDKVVHVQLDTENRFMENPLYGHHDNPTCLLLQDSHH